MRTMMMILTHSAEDEPAQCLQPARERTGRGRHGQAHIVLILWASALSQGLVLDT